MLKLRSVENLLDRLPGLGDRASMRVAEHESDQGTIMAKRKKGAKVQKRGKHSAKRGKARKVAKTAKRAVAKATPKRTPVKKATQKEVVAPAVETLVDTTEIREDSELKPPSLI